jgi:hypothetical protein
MHPCGILLDLLDSFTTQNYVAQQQQSSNTNNSRGRKNPSKTHLHITTNHNTTHAQYISKQTHTQQYECMNMLSIILKQAIFSFVVNKTLLFMHTVCFLSHKNYSLRNVYSDATYKETGHYK